MVTFQCKIVTPEGVKVERDLWQLSIRSAESSFALRARHIDLLFAAEKCTAEVATTPDCRETWEVTDLLLDFSKNRCTMVCKGATKR